MKPRIFVYGLLVLIALVLAVIGFAQGAPSLQSWSLLAAAALLVTVAILAKRRRNM
jgi:hypothetical protein